MDKFRNKKDCYVLFYHVTMKQLEPVQKIKTKGAVVFQSYKGPGPSVDNDKKKKIEKVIRVFYSPYTTNRPWAALDPIIMSKAKE